MSFHTDDDEEYTDDKDNHKRAKNQRSEKYYNDLISQMPDDIIGLFLFAEQLKYDDILILCQLNKRFSEICATERIRNLIKRKYAEVPGNARKVEAYKKLKELINYELESANVFYLQYADLGFGVSPWQDDTSHSISFVRIDRKKHKDGNSYYRIEALDDIDVRILTKAQTLDYILAFMKRKESGKYLYNFRSDNLRSHIDRFYHGELSIHNLWL